METPDILEELLELIDQSGIEIRREAMGSGGGGMCKMKNKTVFFVDTECMPHEMASICAKTVNEILDVETVYLKPRVRQFLEGNV